MQVRKHPRLAGYDYSQNGAYFITVCTKDREEVLGRINAVGRDALGAPRTILSAYGTNVEREIEETPMHYPGVSIDCYVIMPNHLHMIIVVNRDDGAPRASRPTTALIPSIIAILKRKTNKAAGRPLWQSSYGDRIIRNEYEYLKVWQYIDENPLKWHEDRYYVETAVTL